MTKQRTSVYDVSRNLKHSS